MKILYIHNKLMWYRLPYFNKLAEIYDITYVFTDEINTEGLKAKNIQLKTYGKNPFALTPGLIKIILTEKYDLLIFPSISSSYIDLLLSFVCVKLKRKKYIWGSDRWHIPQSKTKAQYFINYIRDKFIGLIAKNAFAYYGPGINHAKFAEYLGVNPDNIFIIPNASHIDLPPDSSDKIKLIRDQYNLEGQKVILFVGRLLPVKGIEYLITAFSKLSKEDDQCILVIIGDDYFKQNGKGENIPKYQKITEELKIGNKVLFLGELPREKIVYFYQLANIFVLPSITTNFKEAWGLVLNEAMQIGKPVLASDAVGAAASLIQQGVNGYIFPEKDVDSLYKYMKEILSNPETQKEMGIQSKKIIENGYTYNHMVESFTKIITNFQDQLKDNT